MDAFDIVHNWNEWISKKTDVCIKHVVFYMQSITITWKLFYYYHYYSLSVILLLLLLYHLLLLLLLLLLQKLSVTIFRDNKLYWYHIFSIYIL